MRRWLMRPTMMAVALLIIGCGADEEVAFVPGSAEDEAAIREIIDQGEALHYADDVDWENAFGGRFIERDAVERFVSEMVEPTLTAAEGTQRVTVRFLGADLAIADSYWRLVGQTGPFPERVGRNTYVLSRSGAEWRINVVRVADLQRDPVPMRAVDAGNPWPSVALSSNQLSLYEGLYEEASFGGMPLHIRIWVEDGVLRSETRTFGVIDLVPMGDHVFAIGRYVKGELLEIYWPDDRQVFQVENQRAVGYKVVDGTSELISASAKRIGEG